MALTDPHQMPAASGLRCMRTVVRRRRYGRRAVLWIWFQNNGCSLGNELSSNPNRYQLQMHSWAAHLFPRGLS